MSEYITLDCATEIRQWMKANAPKIPVEKLKTLAEFLATTIDNEAINEPADRKYYGVMNILYTTNYKPLVSIRRVYWARDAEHALQQYLFGHARHQAGTGEQCVDVTILDNFNYEPQEIKVFPLAAGTNKFY